MLWGEWAKFPIWPFVSLFVFLPLCNVATTFGLKHCLAKVAEAEVDSVIYEKAD